MRTSPKNRDFYDYKIMVLDLSRQEFINARTAMEDFIKSSQSAENSTTVSSMCTVFAESEVVSLATRGVDKAEISLGIHHSIAKRTVSMMNRLDIREKVVFAGGVAFNPYIRHIIEEMLEIPVFVPPEPQIVGAYGCALNCSN